LQHDDGVTQAAFSHDGRLVVTASQDQTARIWDAATGKPMGPAFQHEGAVLDARFSPDGLLIATGCEDAAARLWNVATAELLVPPLEHSLSVRHVAFSPDGQWLLTASWDKTARLWHVSPTNWEPREVETFAQIQSSSRLDNDGERQQIPVDQLAALLKSFAAGRPEVYQLHAPSD
jgi:WD40 repeat protein